MSNALLSIAIYAKLFEFAGQRSNRVQSLSVATLLVEREIDVEHVLPLLPDNRQTLYFSQVEFIERKDREDCAQAAFLMGKCEDEAGFVDWSGVSDGRSFLGLSEDEEAREVVFVSLDALLQHFHSVDVGSVSMADGSVSVSALPADVGCGPCCIVRFDYLEFRMSVEELPALHEGNGMGVHLFEVFPTFIWQTHNAVLDAELVFADNRHAALSQQLVVVEQASGYRVLNRHESQQVFLRFESCEHLFESVAADQFHLLALEEAMGGYVVETAFDALYCYPFHPVVSVIPKHPARFLSGMFRYVFLVIPYLYIYDDPLHFIC